MVGDDIAEEHLSADGCRPSRCRPVDREDCARQCWPTAIRPMLAAEVVEQLAVEEEIFGELVVPSQISPMDWAPIEASVARRPEACSPSRKARAAGPGAPRSPPSCPSASSAGCDRPVAVVASDAPSSPAPRRSSRRMLIGEHRIETAIREAVGLKPVLVPTTDVNSETGVLRRLARRDRTLVARRRRCWPRSRPARRSSRSTRPTAVTSSTWRRSEGAEVRLDRADRLLFDDAPALEAFEAEQRAPATPRPPERGRGRPRQRAEAGRGARAWTSHACRRRV